jgi:hypothetical protein
MSFGMIVLAVVTGNIVTAMLGCTVGLGILVYSLAKNT